MGLFPQRNQPTRMPAARPFSTSAPWLPRRMISTTRISHSHIRHLSFISTATRLAARSAGRLVGVGAIGVGGAAYVGTQLDDLKNNLFGGISTLYQSFNQLTNSAKQ